MRIIFLIVLYSRLLILFNYTSLLCVQWLIDIYSWNAIWSWCGNESNNCHYADGVTQNTVARCWQNWCVSSLLSRLFVLIILFLYYTAVFPNILQRNTCYLNMQMYISVRRYITVAQRHCLSHIIQDPFELLGWFVKLSLESVHSVGRGSLFLDPTRHNPHKLWPNPSVLVPCLW